MNVLTREELITLLVGQCRSADLWVGCWERHKDVGALRNAALAIGKVNGVYNVLLSMNQGGENVPEPIIELVTKYSKIWDELYLPEEI